MQLNKDFPRKLYLDKRVLVNGKKKLPAYINYENHIELSEWIQTLIDNEYLTIPCTCDIPESSCNLKANDDVYKFALNGLEYQFLDILSNDVIDNNLIEDIEIIIESTDLAGNRAIEIVNSVYYKYPFIKLTKPSDNTVVQNIDEPEEFTYKLRATCNGEEIESNIVQVVILPTSVDLENYINFSLI